MKKTALILFFIMMTTLFPKDTLGYIFTAGQDVQLILPVSTPPGSAVHRFHANPSPADVSRPASSAPDFFILVGPNTSIFQLDSRTGVLQLGPAPLSAHFTRPKETIQFRVGVRESNSSSWIDDQGDDTGSLAGHALAILNVSVTIVSKSPDCRKPSKDWCFGPKSGNNRTSSLNSTTSSQGSIIHHHIQLMRIFENRAAGSALTDFSYRIGNFHRFCPDLELRYALVDDHNPWVKLVNVTNERSESPGMLLLTAAPLDRESTPTVGFQLECTIAPTSSSSPASPIIVTQNVTLFVEDEDDNPPRLQDEPPLDDVVHHHVYLKDRGIVEGEDILLKSLMVLDDDTKQANRFRLNLIWPPDELHQPLTKLLQLTNTIWSPPDQKTGVQRTAISIGLSGVLSSQHLFLSEKNPPSIDLTILVEDTNLLPGYGSKNLSIRMRIHPGWPPATDDDLPLWMKNPTGQEKDHTGSPIKRLNTTMSRSACRYTRLLDLYPHGHQKAGKRPSNFRLEPDPPESYSPLAITPDGGILYVALEHFNRNAWPEGFFQVQVDWDVLGKAEKEGHFFQTARIRIDVVGEANAHESCESSLYCAEFRSEPECLNDGIGSVATDHRGCSWRSSSPVGTVSSGGQNSSGLSRMYLTCSPDLTTCPDNYCDDLESQAWEICPQDCTEEVLGPHKMNPSGAAADAGSRGSSASSKGRGIASAAGVCSCFDSKKCSCIPVAPASPMDPEDKLNGSSPAYVDKNYPEKQDDGAITNPSSEDGGSHCDTTCRVLIGLMTTFLIALLPAVLFLYWRKNQRSTWVMCGPKRRRRRPRYVEHLSGTGSGPHRLTRDGSDGQNMSIYIDELQADSTGLVNGNNTSGSNSTTLPFGISVSDRKWQVPRKWLVLESVPLGEGEFGQVMRATVTQTSGIAGHKIVAAKMAKTHPSTTETSSSSGSTTTELTPELADLLSEFHLLKEVSHPNVVQLLGACTDPNGPFLLLLEYCEHGSLRNYLRRARMVGAVASTSGLQQDQPVTIQPRDLLSFAWQISQAGAYLCEMKLVHRDLAARNVLVAAGKVCKISDFGLTRDVYEGDTYFKTSKGRVPIKWMALESLSDHVYTSKSDVWSFGILLWELATLGANPYPGVTPERLYRLLKTGYRMDKPDNCSEELYNLMTKCWREDPHKRPQFAELVKTIEDMLSHELDYLDLDCLIGVSNKEYFMNADDHQQELGSKVRPTLRWDEEEDAVDERPQPHGYLNTVGAAPTAPEETVPLVQEQSVGYLTPIVRSC